MRRRCHIRNNSNRRSFRFALFPKSWMALAFLLRDLPATQLPSGSDLNCWDNCYSHSEDFSDHLHWHRSGSCNPLVCATNNPRLFSKRYTYLDCLSGHHRGIALLRPRITSAPALLAGMLLSTSAMFMWQPNVAKNYSSWPGGISKAELERDVYSGALFLQKFVRAHVRPPASIGFWYSNASENDNLNSMQSMFLWGYSRVQGATGPGMPQIDDAVRQSVQRQPFIGILARTDKEVDDAYSALKTIPINFIEIARANYSAAFKSIRRHYCETCSNSASVVIPIGENSAPLRPATCFRIQQHARSFHGLRAYDRAIAEPCQRKNSSAIYDEARVCLRLCLRELLDLQRSAQALAGPTS